MKPGQKFPVHDGEVIDAYVVGPIFAASGGMSHLFNVTDPTLPLLPLVMKVLPLDRTPDMIARMEREAYALSKMSGCDLIVRIQATGRCSDASPYIVMERLSGEDLKDFLKRSGPLEMSRAVDIALRASLALYACHCEEVLHRDVKPGNLFLHKEAGMREVVKLLDFGISHTGVGPAITAINAYSGTRRYMAPEQWRGRDTEIADQFSLAVVLFEALTGRLPWPPPRNHDNGEHEKLVMSGAFKRLGEVRPELPAALGHVVSKALSPDPDGRYSSIHEFGDALLPFATEGARSFFKEYVPRGGRARSGINVVPLTEKAGSAIEKGSVARAAAAAPGVTDGSSEYATVAVPPDEPTAPALRRRVIVGVVAAALLAAAGVFALRPDAEPPESRASSSSPGTVTPAVAGPAAVEATAKAPPPAEITPLAAPVVDRSETTAQRARERGEGANASEREAARASKAGRRLVREPQPSRRVQYSKPAGNRRGSAIPD